MQGWFSEGPLQPSSAVRHLDKVATTMSQSMHRKARGRLPMAPIEQHVSEEPAVTSLVNPRKAELGRFYLPQLDGLRFIAFMLVFWYHQPPALMQFPVIAVRTLLVRVNMFGWMGVDLFFCLSAFLITSLLLRELGATGDISLRKFYIRRSLRIWPLYFLMLLLIFLVFPMFGFLSPRPGSAEYGALVRQQLFPCMIFLGNFSYAYFPASLAYLLAPLWSISVEEQFYLVWPVLIPRLARAGHHVFGSVLAGLLLVSVLTRIYIVINFIPYPMLWVNTLARLDPLLLGTAVAVLYMRGRPVIPAIWALIIAAAVLLTAVMFPQIGASPHSIWQLSAVALGFAAMVVAVVNGRVSQVLLGNAPMRWAGKLSYGFYVFHRIGMAVADRWHNITAPSGTLRFAIQASAHMGLALLATICISAISYYAFERWFLIMKDRFTIVRSRST
jgi:peptidoglycan/LPS O-acetylase OafA/YrhL